MAVQPTHPDWGALLKGEAFEGLNTGVWDVGISDRLLVCLVAQVLNLLNKQVVVVSTVTAALPPPALVALPCFRLERSCVFLYFLSLQINLYHLVSLLSFLLHSF